MYFYSFNKYLSIYYVPGTMLGAKVTGMNKMGKILNILVRGRYGTDNIQTNTEYIRCQCLLSTLK